MNRRRAGDSPRKSFAPEFGPNGSLRQKVGHRGRVHVDRWLPFIILHRGDQERASLARRIAIESPSYFVWSPDGDAAALDAIEAVIPAMASKTGRLLVVSLDDLQVEHEEEGSQALPEFAAQLGAGDKGDVGRAASALETAMRASPSTSATARWSECRLRLCYPSHSIGALNKIERVDRLTLRVPQIHRRPDGGEFPAIAHELSTSFGDAILRAACAFLDDGKAKAPAITGRWAEAPIWLRLSRPIASSTVSPGASTSCCRSRRSTRTRPSTASLPKGKASRRTSITAR